MNVPPREANGTLVYVVWSPGYFDGSGTPAVIGVFCTIIEAQAAAYRFSPSGSGGGPEVEISQFCIGDAESEPQEQTT